MKIVYFLAAGLLGIVLFASCKKDDTPAISATGKITVTFRNEVDGQPVVLGPLAYTNGAGNKYSVDLLKYYVSNFVLIKADGTEQTFGIHKLINANDPASLNLTLDSVRNGDYTSVRFLLGVDSLHNHTGAQAGDLDPVNGMIWTWNTGYIFYKHEGNYITKTGDTASVVFHLGTDHALNTITVPISKFTVAGNSRKILLKFNLNSAYSSPDNNMDFNIDNNHMSSGPDEGFWIHDMKNYMSDAFSAEKAD